MARRIFTVANQFAPTAAPVITSVTPVAGVANLIVNWTKPTDQGQGISGYWVYVNGVKSSATGLQPAGNTVVTITSGLAFATTYAITMTTVSLSGQESGPSNAVNGTTVAGSALSITSTSPLPAATQGSPYSFTFSATGGVPPYTWSLSGSLAAGLSLSAGGVISGTPTSVETDAITVTVIDSALTSSSKAFSLTINSAATASSLQVQSGTVTVAVGQTGDIIIPIGFATPATPAVVKFYIQADVFIDASNGTAKGVGFGAYDGTRQFSHVHAQSFPTGFRLGGLFLDAIHDAQNNGGIVGARIVGKSLGSNTCTLHIDRAVPAGSSLTIVWQAIAGCNARVDWFEIPPGNYQATGPTGVSITGIPFTPKGFEFHPHKSIYYGAGTPKHALTQADEGFVTAWHAQCIGFASNSGGTIRQGSIGGVVNHDGWHFNMAYSGCIAGPPRTDYNFLWPMGYATSFNSDGVTLNFDSADNGGPYTLYGSTFIAYDCECYAGLTQINAGTGAVSGLTGAPFTPIASLFGAAPNIDQVWPTGSYPDPSILNIVGSENSSIGFAINANGTLKQGGIAKYDQSSYSTIAQQRLLVADIDVNGTGTSTAHDAKGISFTDAVIKGQTRTSQQNFAVNAAVAVTGFVSGGVTATQSAGSGKAGYMAFMHLGATGANTGANSNMNGVKFVAASSMWYDDISAAPVDPNSATMLSTTIGIGSFKLEGLGNSGTDSAGKSGLTYVNVDSRTQPLVAIQPYYYAAESNPVFAPIPLDNSLIENYSQGAVNTFPTNPSAGAAGGNDRHLLAFDVATGFSYELNRAYIRNNDILCNSCTVFDNQQGDGQVPAGATSADVAGLQILPALVRAEEIRAGVIPHAMRFVPNYAPGKYTGAARHGSYNDTTPNYIPFGAKIRLRADYPESGNYPGTSTPITTEAAVVIRAAKKYGLVNADSGGAGPAMWFQADSSSYTTNYPAIFGGLQNIKIADMAVIQLGTVYQYSQSMGPPLAPPTASLAASSNSITTGQSVTLTPAFSGSTKQIISPKPGPIRTATPVNVSPVRDELYSLQVSNGGFTGTGTDPTNIVWARQRVIVTDGLHRETAYDFYCSPTGSMSNAGTIGSPFKFPDLYLGGYEHLYVGMTIGLLDGTYPLQSLPFVDGDTPLIQAIGGAPGKPTILQAVNRRLAIITTGTNAAPAFGATYGQRLHVRVNGVKFVTTAAQYNVRIFGAKDSWHVYDDCEFAGASICGVRATSADELYMRNCEIDTGVGTFLLRVDGSNKPLTQGTTTHGGAIADDYGGNTLPSFS